jgi:hypothetical protein
MKRVWSTIKEFVWRYSGKPGQDYPFPDLILNPGPPPEHNGRQLITRRRSSDVFGSVSFDDCSWYATAFPALQLTRLLAASSDIGATSYAWPKLLLFPVGTSILEPVHAQMSWRTNGVKACYTFPIRVQGVVDLSTHNNVPSSGVPWLASNTPCGCRIINQVPKIILCLNLYRTAYKNSATCI